MKCIICDSKYEYFFSKKYQEPPFDKFMPEIGEVAYYKCTNCGFVLSKTHCELDAIAWSKLNELFHHYLEDSNNERKINQPPYTEQAMMLAILGKNGIINTDNMIDHAAGYGTLSRILHKYHGIKLPIFDPYIQADNSGMYIEKHELATYETVINSAMFEHVLHRADLDQVNNLVQHDGCLIIHTVVCENIPKDPNWFYLRPPVHTAFHTNRSMNILMEHWGYKSSIYCPQSKCWILLKFPIEDFHRKISEINLELQTTWFVCKAGFVDYWKGF
jgi:hypothetical protein